MGTAASRWEWRIFSDAPFLSIAPVFQKLRRANRKRGTDLYVLSRLTEANLKIRAGVLDVKIRVGVSPFGTELWRPAFKSPFPPDAADATTITGFIGTPFPRALGREAFPAGGPLAMIEVVKERDIYMIEDTIIEAGTASFAGRTKWTLCVESEKPEQVEYFVRGCRLDGKATANYVTLLKHFLKI